MGPGNRITPTNSPLRQSGHRTPPHLLPQFSAPPCLPPILASPHKVSLGRLGPDNVAGDICGNLPQLPLIAAAPHNAPHRTFTLPEMTSHDLFSG